MRKIQEIHGRCMVCRHRDRHHIETLLRSGVPQAEILRLYNPEITPKSLENHYNNHIEPEVFEPVAELKTLPENLEDWALLKIVNAIEVLSDTLKVTGSIKAGQAVIQGTKVLLEYTQRSNGLKSAEVSEAPSVNYINFGRLDTDPEKDEKVETGFFLNVKHFDPGMDEPETIGILVPDYGEVRFPKTYEEYVEARTQNENPHIHNKVKLSLERLSPEDLERVRQDFLETKEERPQLPPGQ